MKPAVCAERPKSDRAVTALSLLFFGGMAALSLWLLASGDPVEKLVGAIALALGLLLALCAGYRLLYPPPGRYCLEEETLRFGEESLALSGIRSARTERRPTCPFLKDTLVELALVLEGENGEALALPLTYPDWEAVYEALRERRPDLGLGPWQEDPMVLEELHRGRGAVALPRSARVVRENFALGVLAAFLLAVLLFLPLPRGASDVLPLLAVPLAFWIYHRIVRKRVRIETREGAREVPERPAG